MVGIILDKIHSSLCLWSAKAPFGGPSKVLEYLGRYTHRVAIGNRRLRKLEQGQVSFDWKDYRDRQMKVMTVAADEFIRLFLQHSLPTGLQRIRYYGFLTNRHRAAKQTCATDSASVPGAASESWCDCW